MLYSGGISCMVITRKKKMTIFSAEPNLTIPTSAVGYMQL